MALLVVVVVSIASCDGIGDSTAPTTSMPALTASTTTLFDPHDSQPIITVGSFAWFIPDLMWARDLHRLVVYPSGEVLRYEFDATQRITVQRWSVPAGEVEGWVRLADSAGLADQGVDAAESDTSGMIDGGYAIVTRRLEEGFGLVAIDQPAPVDEGDVTARRQQLSDLIEQVYLSTPPDAVADPVGRWAIESARPMADLDPTMWPWPDVDPAGLVWSFNGEGVRCTTFEVGDWPYSESEMYDMNSLTDGIFRRPLLPHETSCADVFAWRDALGYSAAIPFVPTSLRPQQS